MKTTVDLTKLLSHDGEELLRERVGMLPNVASQRTKSLKARISGAKAVTSLCCYCAVGCSTLAYVSDDGKLLDVEGNPESPINAGHLCPKGSALFGLTVNEARWTTVKYRAPYSDRYEERPLEWALERDARFVVMIPGPITTDVGMRAPGDPMFDAFWQLANDSGVTVCYHSGETYYSKFMPAWGESDVRLSRPRP